MSLEYAIQQNTAAINALIEILKGLARIEILKGATHTSPPPEEVLAAAEPEPAKAAKAAKPAKTEAGKTRAPLEQTVPSPAGGVTDASVTGAAAAPVAKPVTREQVSRALIDLASKKGREAGMKVLAKVAAKTLNEVSPGDYGAVLYACEWELS